MEASSVPIPSGSDKGPALLATAYTLAPLGTILVGLRLYVRCIRQKTSGIDDVLLVGAQALALFGMACGQVFVHYGIGRHIVTLTESQISLATEWLTIAEIENYAGLCLVRLSVGFFLLRLIPEASREHTIYRRIIVAAMVINVLITIAVILVFALQCIPLAGFWNRNIPAKCLSTEVSTNVNRAFGAISAVIDFTFALLPVVVIKGISQMDRKTKILLAVCLSIGASTGICAITKAAVVDLSNEDLTYSIWSVTLCAILEINIGVIAACFPALRQFFRLFYEDIKVYASNRKDSYSDLSSSNKGSPTASQLTHRNEKESEQVITRHTSVIVSAAPREQGDISLQEMLGINANEGRPWEPV